MSVFKGSQVFQFLLNGSTFDHLINDAGAQNALLLLLLDINSGIFLKMGKLWVDFF